MILIYVIQAADFSCSKPQMTDGGTYTVKAGTYVCDDVLVVTQNSKLIFNDDVSTIV